MNAEPLVGRCERASRLGLARLLEVQTPAGIWEDRLDVNAFCAAAFIVMQRTTGAIDLPRSLQDEARLVRHMTRQTNPDGGFWKFPGSPSCRTLTELAALALQLSLGRVSNPWRPKHWLRPNELITAHVALQIERIIRRAETFLSRPTRHGKFDFEFEQFLPTRVLTAYVDSSRRLPPMPFLRPCFVSAMGSWPVFRDLPKPMNLAYRKSLPALSILYEAIGNRRRDSDSAAKCAEGIPSRCAQKLGDVIRSDQGECGGWVYNSLYPSLNLMALRESGSSLSDFEFTQGLRYLRRNIVHDGNGEAFLDFMKTDIWDTAVGVLAYLSLPGRRASDGEIATAVEFLLRWQGASGGYAFGSGFTDIPDTDSTAFVMLSLKLARQTVSGTLQRSIDQALDKGKSFLLSKQDVRGGFPAYEPSLVGTPATSVGLFSQLLFDQATPDVTARALAALAQCGLSIADDPIRRGVKFLLSVQHRNGGWWSRWWSGYLVGTSMVLRCLAKLGVNWTSPPDQTDRLCGAMENAFRRALKFICGHQNSDGGWGETIRADSDSTYAGVGPSTPLHTAVTLWALLTCKYPHESSLMRRGIEYLLDHMSADGRWNDDQAVFTVVSRSFYYRHPIFNFMLPLVCLGKFLRAERSGN